MVLDPVKDKYKADKIILGERHNFKWYFDNIFDKKTFPAGGYWYLAKNCLENFKQWFDKETYPKEDYWWLIRYCSNHFTEWFDKKTFPEKSYYRLAEHCQKYKHIWYDGGKNEV